MGTDKTRRGGQKRDRGCACALSECFQGPLSSESLLLEDLGDSQHKIQGEPVQMGPLDPDLATFLVAPRGIPWLHL